MNPIPEFWCNLCKRTLVGQPSFKGKSYYNWTGESYRQHNTVDLCEPCWSYFCNLLVTGQDGLVKMIDELEHSNSSPKAKQALQQVNASVLGQIFNRKERRSSSWELLMREILKNMNINFSEQVKISGHKVDFVIPLSDEKSNKTDGDLLIEVDGGHHKYPNVSERDTMITSESKADGNTVLRFSDEHLRDSVGHVKQEITKGIKDHVNKPRKTVKKAVALATT